MLVGTTTGGVVHTNDTFVALTVESLGARLSERLGGGFSALK